MLARLIEEARRGWFAHAFPSDAGSLAFARGLDSEDEQKDLRSEFIIPAKASLTKTSLDSGVAEADEESDECIYLIPHGQGLQPKAVSKYVAAQLETWASMGVRGHYNKLSGSPLRPWQDMAEDCAKRLAFVVGALETEVTVMNGTSVNLHLMMASFYKPTERRHKILTEVGSFPSDKYVVESQVRWHEKFKPEESIVKISAEDENTGIISTERILSVIDEHAEETALLLLPGVQYYTGQLFDIPTITAHAKKHGIIVGWDLAHAAGNVELKLHDWNVDFAVWCQYKYLSCGPGSIAGAFVHDSWTKSVPDGLSSAGEPYPPRLSGWYGSEPESRYNREMRAFKPMEGAAGFQVSNPSAMDLAIVSAALSVFSKHSMFDLRGRSMALTAYTQYLLDKILADIQANNPDAPAPFTYLTPRDPKQRGAQLSLKFGSPSVVESTMRILTGNGIACDLQKSGLMRLSPSPMYTRFEDLWIFGNVLRIALGLP
ncbi:hypothetical protein NLG97_g6247 [Lecanicillium saksenae]|uniref:Uncharacterized protein n=1 Tax=Lecanicillium saksenae TaxID=468837 RepID=A0ACC1QU01_9HYPO|nr:hypothetical protein NLG97_g6247 [Lecanicillium saksenae]